MASAREVAVRILMDLGDTSRVSYYVGLSDERDRSLAFRLAAGCLRWRGLLDFHLQAVSKRKLDRLSSRLLAAMRLGAYQLLFTDTPAYAAVHTAVGLLRYGGERAYANGVLRVVAKNAGHVEMPSLDDDPAGYLAIRFSHPTWVAKLLVDRFGPRTALRIADADNREAPLSLRVSKKRTTQIELLKSLRESGCHAEEGISSGFVRVLDGGKVEMLPGFSEGLFVVQDEGAAAIAAALGVLPGDSVWDVCAAPGGKTSYLAEMAGDRGRVYATDIDAARVRLIDETVERLGLHNIQTAVLDATLGLTQSRKFRRILVDAPCSGLGVMRRHPDLRWNRREDDVPNMVRRQKALLFAAAPHLCCGGTLVYSTCTLTLAENEGVWETFLAGHPELRPFDPLSFAGEFRPLFFDASPVGAGCRYILPGFSGTDGFFVACARKEERDV